MSSYIITPKMLADHAAWVDDQTTGKRLVIPWGANLDGASLDGASLDGASLVGASLVGASLVGASLVGASLVGANLVSIRDDFYQVLNAAPAEVSALLVALVDGRVDGMCYEGDCACLIGTIANTRGCCYAALEGLTPDTSRPAERWFLAIQPGHTPENSQVAKITADWIAEWQAMNPVATQPK